MTHDLSEQGIPNALLITDKKNSMEKKMRRASSGLMKTSIKDDKHSIAHSTLPVNEDLAHVSINK